MQLFVQSKAESRNFGGVSRVLHWAVRMPTSLLCRLIVHQPLPNLLSQVSNTTALPSSNTDCELLSDSTQWTSIHIAVRLPINPAPSFIMCPMHQGETASLPTQIESPSAGEGFNEYWIKQTPRGLTFGSRSPSPWCQPSRNKHPRTPQGYTCIPNDHAF